MIAKDVIEKLYWKENLSIRDIALRLNLPHMTLYGLMKKYNLPRRSKSEAFTVSEAFSSSRFGKRHSPSTEFKKGLVPWNKGVKGIHPKSEFTSERMRALWCDPSYREKISKARRKLWQDDEYRQKILFGLLNRRPTKPERRFIDICKKLDLPYCYVGNGSFWLGRLNPDFINVNKEKIAIEIFGDYWHSPLLNKTMPKEMSFEYRNRKFMKYGWRLVVFWEHEIMGTNAEEIVLKKLGGVSETEAGIMYSDWVEGMTLKEFVEGFK